MKVSKKDTEVVKVEKPNLPHDEDEQAMENHKVANKHHKKGDPEKASKSTTKDKDDHARASEA